MGQLGSIVQNLGSMLTNGVRRPNSFRYLETENQTPFSVLIPSGSLKREDLSEELPLSRGRGWEKETPVESKLILENFSKPNLKVPITTEGFQRGFTKIKQIPETEIEKHDGDTRKIFLNRIFKFFLNILLRQDKI